ncbi:hypothetical protein [Streptomyces sp. RKAG293]|uniref:hypothetical protein n=1 Tax=Streptomyces sp. RKAG293 TaxID=2893403 RepID=UPI0020346190|nr:hypothetical protein [Streptomyces sp. RKAG293]MCM2416656.1 hypothetical protein [Streptomyces sp. RKAG293]
MPRVELPREPNERGRQWMLHLPASDVAALWPQIRRAAIPEMVKLASIRYFTMEFFSTTAGVTTLIRYHPDDIHQVARNLAEDRMSVPAAWRTDTPEGTQAERLHQRRRRQGKWASCLFIPALLAVLLAVAWTVALLLK